MSFLTTLIIVCILNKCSSRSISDPPRPSYPLNSMFQGWWYCGSVSPYCISEAIVGYQGMIQGWIKFNAIDGLIDNYREDAVINNTDYMFNKEYVTRTQIKEYSLATSTTSNYACYSFKGTNDMYRDWLQNATYIGITKYDGIDAYEFHNFWEIKGYKKVPFIGYVSVDTEQILGWTSLDYVYRYINMISLDSIESQIFEPPLNVNCTPIKSS
eukprot:95199_1